MFEGLKESMTDLLELIVLLGFVLICTVLFPIALIIALEDSRKSSKYFKKIKN
jgi:hypothetical protein